MLIDDLPGNKRQSLAFFVDEDATGRQDLTLVQRREGQSGSRGRVFHARSIAILQRAELVLTQHFPHHKAPKK